VLLTEEVEYYVNLIIQNNEFVSAIEGYEAVDRNRPTRTITDSSAFFYSLAALSGIYERELKSLIACAINSR
jgi:hypothetical protein